MRIHEFTPFDGTDGRVVAYLHSPLTEVKDYRKMYPSVVICPGGGYQFCSTREADPVCFEYLSAGYNVFILYYSVKDKIKHFNPLKELSSTVMAIRANSDEWNCDPEKIAVTGFSAGGHLAASLCTLWNNEEFLSQFDNKGGLNKPNAGIINYAVISTDADIRHTGSFETLSQGEIEELNLLFSLEKQVGKHCPPMFVFHTVDDTVVPVENALVLINALQKNKIPFEAHLFPSGVHGISVCTKEVASANRHVRQWVDLSKNWLSEVFDFTL